MKNKNGYYYLHTNGDLIYIVNIVVDMDSEYFNSPFVKKYWKFECSNRFDAWMIILEALALDCNMEVAKNLSNKWGLNKEDSILMLKFCPNPSELMKKGMSIFIEKILNLNVSDYWNEIQSMQPLEVLTIKSNIESENLESFKKLFKEQMKVGEI